MSAPCSACRAYIGSVRIANDADPALITDQNRHWSDIAARPQSRLGRIQQFRGVVGECAHTMLIATPVQILEPCFGTRLLSSKEPSRPFHGLHSSVGLDVRIEAIFLLLMFGIVGLPVPDKPLMIFSGYLVSTGHLDLVPTLLVAFAGSVSGITTSYLLGRTLGLGFVHKYGRYIHVTEKRLNFVHSSFDRIGHWVLFIGYYIAGVRHFSALIAGTSCLEYRSFAIYAYSGAAVWVCTFIGIGYYFGDEWRMVAEIIHANLLLISAFVVVVGGAYGVYWWRRNRSRIDAS